MTQFHRVAAQLAAAHHIDAAEAEAVVELVLVAIMEAVLSADQITLPGLGSIRCVTVAERQDYHPSTGVPIITPSSTHLKFEPSTKDGAVAEHFAHNGNPYAQIDVSDDTLVAELEGFRRGFADVNGTRLHYVEGGKGTPVILMPGWPQTWWAFHHIMPRLAESHHVIAVDIRGMGASDKPEGGYDKKNMARDIYELMQSLGYEKVHIVGHDIGGQIAYPFSALYPEATWSTTYIDLAGLPASISEQKLLPGTELTGDFSRDFFIWWFAFHQVKGMPERLLEGRTHIYLQWFWESLLYNQDAMTERDRAVYASAYDTAKAIRAGNRWYQAFPQDLLDNKSFPEKIDVPSLGIGGLGYGLLVDFMQGRISNPEILQLKDSGHYLAEEAPEEVTSLILDFIGRAEEN